jgi:hypothetical protein
MGGSQPNCEEPLLQGDFAALEHGAGGEAEVPAGVPATVFSIAVVVDF